MVRDQRHAPATIPPAKDPVHIVLETEWLTGPVWMGVENLDPHLYSILGISKHLKRFCFFQSDYKQKLNIFGNFVRSRA